MPLNFPILLTWLRILAIPFVVGVYSFPDDWLTLEERNWIATALFVLAALTDWLDGYFARRWNQTSAFGAFLDPVADKLMVCATLLILLKLGRVDSWVALIIVGREITISALREWMAELGARGNVAVNWLGKIKTIAQMVALPMLLADVQLFPWFNTLQWGTWLVWVATLLTLWSMFYYLKQALPTIRKHQH
ncbi:MAG: CDP-diacylglycerol--glycerol-3-phosphate 3-phosphatidyltransferase [Burkholderiaceae bacterium]|nr:MAG: CDP-diacylglycerol--glycerol-3-phosphate 3-phosphatidyltransferase [Burkholderiaceae bacterium]